MIKNKKIKNLVCRDDFSNIDINWFEEPNLLDIQKNYEKNIKIELDEFFNSYFPISHIKNSIWKIEYNGLELVNQKPSYNEIDSKFHNTTYGKMLQLHFSLTNEQTGEVKNHKLSIKDKKKGANEGIFFGIIPSLTKKGTFIINGVEKAVISQIVRSPGLYCLVESRTKLSNKRNDKTNDTFELLPYKGSLMILYVSHKNKNSEVRAAIRTNSGKSVDINMIDLLIGLGLNMASIQEIYKDSFIASSKPLFDFNILNDENASDVFKYHKFLKIKKEIISSNTKKTELKKNNYSFITELINKCLNASGAEKEKILNNIISEATAIELVEQIGVSIHSYLPEVSYQQILADCFTNKRRYSVSKAGRFKLNNKYKFINYVNNCTTVGDITNDDGKVVISKNTQISNSDCKLFIDDTLSTGNIKVSYHGNAELEKTINLKSITLHVNGKDVVLLSPKNPISENNVSLTLTDFIVITNLVACSSFGIKKYDDIEHLGNKRVRTINEQLMHNLTVGMAKVEKNIKEKLSSFYSRTAVGETKEKIEAKATVKNTVNSKWFQLELNRFFNTGELTQFIEERNPLSDLSAKRKLSATGPGGISKDDPSMEVRDIHYSQYGKICPIESPEGQNVGLIMSLSSYAKINDFGFIITPYRVVKNKKITNEVVWLTATEEDNYVICDSNIKIEDNIISEPSYECRFNSEIISFPADEIQLIEVGPNQLFSLSTCLIPFIECDDGHRAEMGSNMQRQALPLITPRAPTVGTGIEYRIAHDSSMGINAEDDGVVTYVDNSTIKVGSTTYDLNKYRKSNQNTCINQTPIVSVGDKIEKGEVIADASGMNNGELSLGQNVLVAYTTWNGYNFEDAIVISDRLIKEDIYTSISIEEFSIKVLKTKNGDEEVTRDIGMGNNSSADIANLDENGVIRIGSYVTEGNVLVGKITPRATANVENNPTTNLLFNIFKKEGFEKINKTIDSSLRVPHGCEGVVCDIKHFSLENNDNFSDKETLEVYKIYIAQKRKIEIGDKMAGRHGNKGVISIIVPQADMPYLPDGTPIDICLNPHGVPARINIGQIWENNLGLIYRLKAIDLLVENVFEHKNGKVLSESYGIQLPKANVLFKEAKKYFENMKWDNFKDAKTSITATDLSIILSNAGLIIEDLNLKCLTPIFVGANKETITNLWAETNTNQANENMKFDLYDGRTGEKFDNQVTVGVSYIMKLDHMVQDKIHARSIGPYSRTTQQPLGGRSQNGGQRLGEMEVWAFEAHGASYNLQELMTYKSDDVIGRRKLYNAILKNNDIPQPSFPDSFKLMTKILQGLNLQVNAVCDDLVVDINNIFKSQSEVANEGANGEVLLEEKESSNYGEEGGDI